MIDTKSYKCSNCVASFNLSSALFVHQLQIHAPPKISQLLDVLLPRETIYSSDDEFDYTFEINISYERSTKPAIINVKEELFDDKVISILTTLKVEPFDSSEEDHSPLSTTAYPFVQYKDELVSKPTYLKNGSNLCELCDKSVRPCNMRRHLRVVHTLNLAEKAKLSSKIRKKSVTKRKDKNTEIDQGGLLTCQTCHICGLSFYASNMKRHLKAAHKLNPEKLSSIIFKNEKERKKVFTCPICKKTYELIADLSAHYSEFHPTTGDETSVILISNVNNSKHWRCTICNHVSDYLYRCVQHIQKDHQDVVARIEANVNESFGCHLCQVSLKPFECLVEHSKEHKPKTPHQCTQCGEILVSAARLKTHNLRKHSDLRPFICDICSKSFKDKYTVLQHILIHVGRKTYVCQVTGCAADFAYASGLRQHISLHHNKEKRFECEECGKIFKLGHQLKHHIRLHTGEKPFECTVCGKRFRNVSGRKKHLMMHNNIRPHKCNICEKGFITFEKLRMHTQRQRACIPPAN